MLEDVKKIVEAGIQAPSGDNCQPWEFKITNDSISIFNVPDRDRSFYNLNNLASMVSHGAVIENISIACKYFGYEPLIKLFPEEGNNNFVAHINLKKINTAFDEKMYKSIYQRVTNRKKYYNYSLSNKEKENILSGINFTENLRDINRLAKAASVNERLLFENGKMRQFFYEHTNFENSENPSGFNAKVLEFNPLQLAAVKLFKNKKIFDFLNSFGGLISLKVSKDTEKIYKKSSLFGAITVKNIDKYSFINAGRDLQKIWLNATNNGLSLQPLTGVLFLMNNIKDGKNGYFTERQIDLVSSAYKEIKEVFKIKDEIALMFRMGKAEKPSAKALRFPLESFIKMD